MAKKSKNNENMKIFKFKKTKIWCLDKKIIYYYYMSEIYYSKNCQIWGNKIEVEIDELKFVKRKYKEIIMLKKYKFLICRRNTKNKNYFNLTDNK